LSAHFFLSGGLLTFPKSYSRDIKHGFFSDSVVRHTSGLLPVPQQLELSGKCYPLNNGWSLEIGAGITSNDPAVLSLATGLKEKFGFSLKKSGAKSTNAIRLLVKPGVVAIGKSTDTNRVSLSKQAYRIRLSKTEILITANAPHGLFYGVQTLKQLLERQNNQPWFPVGEITDWPDMDLRMIYWDDAHHLERLDAMKKAIRQAGMYKINAFALKLEGHFQFSSAKPVVEPYAYTPEEFQELTNYARSFYIDLIPYIDAPAHISFI